jgi:hypothetical protein
MWELIKSNPWTTGICVLGTIAAIVGVIIGILTKGNWPDNGLLEANNNKIRWPIHYLPIPILVKSSVSTSYFNCISTTASVINQQINMTLFKTPIWISKSVEYIVTDLPPRQCIIQVGVDPTKGTTEHKYDTRTGIVSAAIVTLPPELESNETKLNYVILHELLHVLGLAHDNAATGSIMAPTAEDISHVITQNDINLLRTTYSA